MEINGALVFAFLIVAFLNKIYNNFIILIDTQELISSLIKPERNLIRKSKKIIINLNQK